MASGRAHNAADLAQVLVRPGVPGCCCEPGNLDGATSGGTHGRLISELGDDLGEGGAEVVPFGGGEGSRGVPFKLGAGIADWFADRLGEGGEVQPDQAAVCRVGLADQQAGFFHAGGGLDDGGGRGLKAVGSLLNVLQAACD
jgi:hypothetical protein